MALPKWVSWGLFAAAAAAVGVLWHGPHARDTIAKAGPDAADHPAARTRLVVDFRDDISSRALEANGYVEIPVSEYSARDRLYAIDFSSLEDAAAARAKLARDPNVESVDYDAEMTIPPDEAAMAGDDSMEAECAGRVAAARPPEGTPNDPCWKYQWHLRQVGLPEAWKLGSGKGAVVAV